MEKYKLILSGNKFYREIDLCSDEKLVKVGTTGSCNIRLDAAKYFEDVEFDVVNSENIWTLSCPDNIYATSDGVLKVKSKSLIHGDHLTLKYRSSNQVFLTISFMFDFDSDYKDYERIIEIADISKILIGGTSNCHILLDDPLIESDFISIDNSRGKLIISDNGYQYGVYINGTRIKGKSEIRDYDFFRLSVTVFIINMTKYTHLKQHAYKLKISKVK